LWGLVAGRIIARMADPTRRDVLQATLAAVAAAIAADGRDLTGQSARPNILWLVSEDNNPYLGCYGDALARTPNIDALARRGLLFRHVFSAAPVCAPSRFGILTGVHPESCAPANQMRATAVLPPEIRTYPEYLREAGYYCTNNAKTDFNCTADPAKIFDESGATAHYRNRPVGRPFFAIFNHNTSHESSQFSPISGAMTPDRVRVPAYLPDTPEVRAMIAQYYNSIERMDAEVGQKLRELEDSGLADDTIVFYYSDNGGVLPRSKRFCYDEGLRCALVVAFPPKWAHLAPAKMGTAVAAPVMLVDLAPTLLSLLGVPTPPQMQGTAFLGPHARSRGPYAFGMRNRMDERYDFVRAVADGRFHYVRNYTPHRVYQYGAYMWQSPAYQSWEREYRAGRLNDVQKRFFEGPRPFEELFDLANDRDQVRNLAGEPAHADRLGAMRQALDDHMIAIVDNGFIPEGMPEEGYYPSRNAQAYPLRRLMALGARAAARDRANVTSLLTDLQDPNPIVRHWAAQGLVMLGANAAPGRSALETMMRRDAVVQNRVVAAEALATIAPSPDAVRALAAVVDGTDPWPVKLQALNALAYLGGQARAVLPTIKTAALVNQEYVSRLGRYLEAVLEGRYDPAYPVFGGVGAGPRGGGRGGVGGRAAGPGRGRG
jgi:arylsulfatase A-like enzyme